MIRKYAAEVSGIDDGVGRVMAALERLELDENTLVVFTADQGLSGGHSGFWGMGDHTRPLTGFDWTTAYPSDLSTPRSHSRRASASTCWSATSTSCQRCSSYLGSPGRTPTSPHRPDEVLPTVEGREIDDWDNTVFYEFENVRAIRTDRWKYIERFRQSPNELYDLAADPEELDNLIDEPAYADTSTRADATACTPTSIAWPILSGIFGKAAPRSPA